MSGELLQTIVVSIAALAAAGVVVRRVFFSPAAKAGQEGCAGCPSAEHRCSKNAETKAAAPALISIKRLTSTK